MNFDFFNQLVLQHATIPAAVNRIAGFFLVLQAVLIFLQKKNDPHKDVWEDISNVLLAGLVVFLFPEFVKFAELAVNALCATGEHTPESVTMELMKVSLLGEEPGSEAEDSVGMGFTLGLLVQSLHTGMGSSGSFAVANFLLKPLADIVNVLCFPAYMFIRAASLKVAYMTAPLVVMLGAFAPFRALWKHWFMIYFALLVSGPALVLANDFCEECFALYVSFSDSPILGFIMVALARFKIFQAVVDLCHRIFRI